jgi:SAM-dependent methyltransferase
MTGFSADWLALREPFDRSARQAAAAAFDLPALAGRLRGDKPALEVVDLACGTGANLRELGPRLRGPQRWLLVDHDPQLLAALPAALAAWAAVQGLALRGAGDGWRIDGSDWQAEVRLQRLDLSRQLALLPWREAALVTAAALLDLVSAAWLDELLTRAGAARAALLFALTVDGRVAWTPALVGDALAARRFEVHQRRDKGFGAALGGTAADLAAARWAASGYDVTRCRSDWHIDGGQGPAARAMLSAMVAGTAAAALEQAPAAGAALERWRAQRLAVVARTRLRVGHLDLLATPNAG